ncbi:MAG: hypothetical protein AAFQ57_09515, partial [Cyanobacteria bacterium J06626_14]
ESGPRVAIDRYQHMAASTLMGRIFIKRQGRSPFGDGVSMRRFVPDLKYPDRYFPNKKLIEMMSEMSLDQARFG